LDTNAVPVLIVIGKEQFCLFIPELRTNKFIIDVPEASQLSRAVT